MSDGRMSLPVPASCAEGMPDALLRLSVLFPDCRFEAASGSVEVTGALAGREREIALAVSDQIIRSDFDLRNAGLRHRLYARLLG